MSSSGDDHERGQADQEFGDRLDGLRPVPAAGFRGALGRWLAERDPGYGPRPERLRLMVAAWVGAGTALVLAGTLVSVGAT